MSGIGDVYNDVEPQLVLAPINKTASFNSSAVDSKNMHALSFYVQYGATGDTLSANIKVDCKVQKSTTSNFSVAVDCDAAEVFGPTGVLSANSFANIDSNTEDEAVYGVGVKPDPAYRYYRVAVTFTGTHTYGIEMAILAIKYESDTPDTTANKTTP